jgi:hypothetical protein
MERPTSPSAWPDTDAVSTDSLCSILLSLALGKKEIGKKELLLEKQAEGGMAKQTLQSNLKPQKQKAIRIARIVSQLMSL